MNQINKSRMIREDKKYLEDEIRLLKMRVEEITDKNLPGRMEKAKELQRLRRMRQAQE